MTRENDVFLPLQLRAHIANLARDAIFVSIHFNATANRDATGFEIFSLTPRGAPSTADDALALSFVNMQAGSVDDAQSFELSAAVYHSMLGHLPEFDRGIKRARFAVLRLTKIPAILVEGGFLSESNDSKLVANPTWRGKLAEAISIGIENYRNVIEKKQRPMLAADYRAQAAGGITVLNLAEPPACLENSAAPGVVSVSNAEPASTREP
jgi:N-acetylmuramoyl-L-alanine amidase